MTGKEVIFLHPDLGVGGAERLAVDAAIALQTAGYQVSFVTSYHSKDHCFAETKDGTLHVDVVGSWIPRNFFGRFFALFAYLKMIYCALYVAFFRSPDLVFCDLVSVCVPFLKIRGIKVMFYCHFPDQLLSRKEGLLKDLYRAPLNWLEEKTTGMADVVFVNSNFTKTTFRKTFPSLAVQPIVLFPSINTKKFDEIPSTPRTSDDFVFLSINRFERKKHVEIAVEAFKNIVDSVKTGVKFKLQIVGGYDPRIEENVSYFNELKSLVESLKVSEKVEFYKSPSDETKTELLRNCDCLVYTPPNEHFGIVPLEAMYMGKPVVACKSGGPLETIDDGKSGILCDFDPETREKGVQEFTGAMMKILEDPTLKTSFGKAGRQRFDDLFSFKSFSRQLVGSVETLLGTGKQD